MAKKKLIDLDIVEMFLVKCGNDWTRTYLAQLTRDLDADGNPIIFGKVEIEGFTVKSNGKTEEEIGENLDFICELILNSDISILEEVKSYYGIIEINHN
jgi:hypothetical protein